MSDSPFQVAINLFKCTVCPAVLAMPYCVSISGYVPALAVFLIVPAITIRTTVQVATCAINLTSETSPVMRPNKKHNVFDDEDDDVISYLQLCEITFGAALGRAIGWNAMFPCAFFCGVCYFVFLSQNTISALEGSTGGVAISPVVMTGVICAIQMAICTPRSTSFLAYTSVFGNIAFVAAVVCMTYYAIAVQGLHISEMKPFVSFSGALQTFGVLVMSFAVQGEMLGVMSSAGSRVRRNVTLIVSLVETLVGVIFLAFAFVAYAAFGDATRPIIFDNISHENTGGVVRMVRLATTVMVGTSYPLTMFPLFHLFETSGLVDPADTSRRLAVRYAVIIASAVFSLSFLGRFATVTAVAGGCAAAVSYLLPPLFSWAIIGRPESGFAYAADLFVLGCGGVCVAMSLFSTNVG